jgi:hypothetical protein
MKIFSILKIDDEYSIMQHPSDGLRPDTRTVSPNQSGVTTTHLDGVSVILIRGEIFLVCIYLIISARVKLCTSSTSFYTCRIRSPTDTQTVLFIRLSRYGHIKQSVEYIQTTREYFKLNKKTRVFERACIVAQ